MVTLLLLCVARSHFLFDPPGLFDNLITVFTTDNGGPTTTGDGVGAQNWPLKGGKVRKRSVKMFLGF